MIGLGVLLATLAVLLCALGTRRGWLRPIPPPRARRVSLGGHVVAVMVLALSNLQLVCALATDRTLLLGDLRSHAMIAREIALGRAPTGWVDVYGGGFPLGPHYPSVGWLSAAALMRMGVPPAKAVTWLGVCAVLLAHWLVFRLAMKAGASFTAALAGAVTVSSMAFITVFFGGAQSILVMGVLSQAVAVPPCLLLASGIVTGMRRRWVVVIAALAVASHPQVVAAEMVLLGVVAIAAGRLAIRRWVLAGMAQVILGAAMFGPGLASLHVPFGWPPMDVWRTHGRPARVFFDWLLTGEIFDFARLPVVTTVLGCCLVVVATRVRRRASRLALVACGTAVAIACSGESLASAGRVGSLLLGFLQPMRAYVLIPFAAGALVVVATMDVESVARGALARVGGLRLVRWASFAILASLFVFMGRVVLPLEWREVTSRRAHLASGPCGPSTPKGYDVAAVDDALARLSSGRLYYAEEDFADCAATTDLELSSAVPIGYPFSAGAHVGVLFHAFEVAAPALSGGSLRAESLGVRYLLMRNGQVPADESWHRHAIVGETTLWERVGGSDAFGAGCVNEVWRGDDGALRSSVLEALDHRDSGVWDPARWTALEWSAEPTLARRPTVAECDSTKARVTRAARVAPGEYEADVDAGAPTDIVLRETAYPTWRFSIDGAPAEYRTVAPGFMVVHVAVGRHHVHAKSSVDIRYLAGVVVALAGVAALACLRRRRR